MEYNVYDLGYDKTLNRGGAAASEVPYSPVPSPFAGEGSYGGGLVQNLTDGSTAPNFLSSGNLSQILFSGKQTFTDTTAGFRMGVDKDGVFKWVIGTLSSYVDWSVTTIGVLTISGTLAATAGAIGGFNIGSDYIRDTANSFGLASTVTGGDDVRFWAGDTFTNRATAPLRITEAGAITATSAAITGTISGRSTATVASAIDASGNLVTDLVNARIDSSAKTILSDFNFGSTDYAGAVKSGTITWNTSTGAITGGSGVVVYRSGIVGANSGVTTFSIDAATGAATFAGTLSAPTGSIGGWTISTTSLVAGSGATTVGLDTTSTGADDVRIYAGSATPGSAPFRVTEAGALTATSATITGALTTGVGSALNGTYVTDNTITSAKVNVAARGWTQTSAFSVSDSDTVAWGSGTFTASDGTAYSISGGNTGNMAAKTYIYLDIATSTTAYQTTTTASTAVGDGKVLIAVAQNNTTEATFQVFGGNGGMNIDAASIVASSITANEIAASTITAGKLSISTLSAITANMGTITAGTITLDTAGYIRGGQTDYNTGTGFFLGYSGSAYKLSIGDSTTNNSITWDGSILTVNGSTVSGNDIFGSGVDGAFALDGTNTYATYMSKSGNDYTLIKDVYATTFTMSGSATLTTNGYRLFAKTSLTTGASNVIKWNGANGGNGGNASSGSSGTGGTAGAANTSANLFGGTAGSAGGNGGTSGGNASAGTAGVNVTNSFALSAHSVLSGAGGLGGADGAGTAPDFTFGASGAAGSISSASSVRPYSAAHSIRMYDELPGASLAYLRYQTGVGGAGGGGGGRTGCIGATGGPGGGGGGSGSSGGTLVICARTISHAGSITATGGNGGNGGNGFEGLGGAFCGGGGRGRGGGGGGGAGSGGPGGQVVLTYSSLSGAGTITAAGGTAGSPGTGGAGGVGTAGGGTGATGATGASGATGPSGVVIQLIV